MLSLKAAVYTAPAIAARVVEFMNQGDAPPHVTVENLDSLASVAIKMQESDDGNAWTDVVNTFRTINPGTSAQQDVVSSRSRLALHAGGNVRLLVSVKRQVDGAPTSFGAA